MKKMGFFFSCLVLKENERKIGMTILSSVWILRENREETLSPLLPLSSFSAPNQISCSHQRTVSISSQSLHRSHPKSAPATTDAPLSSLYAKPPPTAPLSPSLLLNHRRPLHHRRPQCSTISTFYRFGRIYEQGHYPQWDEDHPLHFVGHSAGAQVVRVLQQMLADKAFRGYEDTSENWVLSITSLSGAFNGTTRAYLDGMQPEDGRSMKPICLLQLLRLGVIVYDWLDIRWIKAYFNFGFDPFNMSWKNIGVWGLADCLMGNTGPSASGDWILPDLTIQGSMRLNSHLRTFPDTFYFSYATKRTTRIAGSTVPSGILRTYPLLLLQNLTALHSTINRDGERSLYQVL